MQKTGITEHHCVRDVDGCTRTLYKVTLITKPDEMQDQLDWLCENFGDRGYSPSHFNDGSVYWVSLYDIYGIVKTHHVDFLKYNDAVSFWMRWS